MGYCTKIAKMGMLFGNAQYIDLSPDKKTGSYVNYLPKIDKEFWQWHKDIEFMGKKYLESIYENEDVYFKKLGMRSSLLLFPTIYCTQVLEVSFLKPDTIPSFSYFVVVSQHLC